MNMQWLKRVAFIRIKEKPITPISKHRWHKIPFFDYCWILIIAAKDWIDKGF